MKSKEYSRHVYDLELKSLLDTYKNEIRKVKLSAANETQNPEYFAGLIEFVINEYCNFKGIQFDEEVQIIVTPESNDIYNQFLGVSLVFYDTHKIAQYLNYQREQFEKLSKSKNLFINLVEFDVADRVKNSSPFDNSRRLSVIMDWVENKKNQPPVLTEISQENTKKIFDPQKDYLIWDVNRALIQNEFSFALSKSGFTSGEYDFVKVFQKKRMIGWRKGIQAWVYFMSRLSKDKYITTSQGEVPYLKIGRYYFTICDERKKIIEKVKEDLSEILYNVLKSNKKYVKMRQEVDLLVEKVLKKK